MEVHYEGSGVMNEFGNCEFCIPPKYFSNTALCIQVGSVVYFKQNSWDTEFTIADIKKFSEPHLKFFHDDLESRN